MMNYGKAKGKPAKAAKGMGMKMPMSKPPKKSK